MIIGSAVTVSLAFMLGLRHGLDADHLAAIDGLTRCNTSARHRFAPYCGVLFSAGHAGAILCVAIALAVLASRWDPPAWLASAGTLISAGTLLMLGFMNLRAGLVGRAGQIARSDAGADANAVADAGAVAHPVGLRSRLFASVLRAPRAWQVALVGALFAVSFDAIAIATLFAASSSAVSGVIGIALAFATGMLLVGAANGFWVVRLLRHSGDASQVASRVMTLTIGSVALLVGGCVLFLDAYEFLVSGLVVTLVLAGYCLSLILAHRVRQESPRPHLTPDIPGR